MEVVIGKSRLGLTIQNKFTWSLLSQCIYGISLGAMFILLGHLGTPKDVGYLAFGMAVVIPLFYLINFLPAQEKVSKTPTEEWIAELSGFRIMGTLGAIALMGVLAGVLGAPGQALGILLFLGLAKGMEGLSDLLCLIQKGLGKENAQAKSRALRGPLGLVGFAIGFLGFKTPMAGVAGMALAWWLMLVAWDLNQTFHSMQVQGLAGKWNLFQPQWRWKGMPRDLVPKVLLQELHLLILLIPCYWIPNYLGWDFLGIYASMGLLVWGLLVLSQFFVEPYCKGLRELYQEEKGVALGKRLLRIVGAGTLWGLVAILLAWALGKPVLTLLYGSFYGAYAGLLPWLLAAAVVLFCFSLLERVLEVLGGKDFPLWLEGGMALAILFGAGFLVPHMGLAGAAWSFLFAGMVLLPIQLILLESRLQRLRH